MAREARAPDSGPTTPVLGAGLVSEPGPPTLACAATVPLTVGAEQLCPGPWSPDVWSYVAPPSKVCGERQAEE